MLLLMFTSDQSAFHKSFRTFSILNLYYSVIEPMTADFGFILTVEERMGSIFDLLLGSSARDLGYFLPRHFHSSRDCPTGSPVTLVPMDLVMIFNRKGLKVGRLIIRKVTISVVNLITFRDWTKVALINTTIPKLRMLQC